MRKTFKIGEYALGGIVTVEVDNNAQITVQCKDWETKQPILTGLFDFVDKYKLQMWLEDEVTTAYYADKIIKSIYA